MIAAVARSGHIASLGRRSSHRMEIAKEARIVVLHPTTAPSLGTDPIRRLAPQHRTPSSGHEPEPAMAHQPGRGPRQQPTLTLSAMRQQELDQPCQTLPANTLHQYTPTSQTVPIHTVIAISGTIGLYLAVPPTLE